MKRLALLCTILAVFVSGCGKKQKKIQPKSKTLSKSCPVKKKNKSLVLKDTEDFFDNDTVSNFAFVDDENEQKQKVETSTKKDKTEKNDLALAQNDSYEEDAELNDVACDDNDEPSATQAAFKAVHFDLNHNKIRSDQKKLVVEDCKIAKEAAAKGKKLVVHGHCCQLGSHSYNMALSQQRAEAIKREMVSNGIAEKDIKTVGYGSEMPLVWSEKSDRSVLVKELAPNRRAEIMVN